MPPCPMPGALMMAGATVVAVAVQPTAHGFPAGSAAIAVSCSGLIAGVICAVAPVRLRATTPAPDAASTCDPAATTPDSAVPPPAGTWAQVVPFHSAAAVSARPVMIRPDCGAGSLVQVVPSNWSTWSPPAIQTCPGATVTASSEPISGTLTCRQVLPFQCNTSDTAG